ncbi:MAG: aminotransferase class V-fold PLP-dependent enzyme [Acidobacteriota bacterium]|nr:aminotransferase class V-fold PLP-dependent enzyme [Acidobacteriota bacterium]MDQ7088088.1 aminotransferase class V-fold PLP-dependent enzyme [Acidobacteriota bacterium]
MTVGTAPTWLLDPQVTFLNHGSFGSCPRQVLDHQAAIREQLEREPVLFLARELPGRLAAARLRLGRFVGARADDLAFVTNASAAVGAVLASIPWRTGDGILLVDHAYNACLQAARLMARRHGLTLQIARIPFPVEDPSRVTEAILDAATPATRLALIDHVTSPTGLVLPIGEIVEELAARGIETLVDGAHGPGMLDLDLDRLGAAWYTGNCHKWICAPKGAAFLHVRQDLQAVTRPLTISHGAAETPAGGRRFRAEFDWMGTRDPSAWLAVPFAIDFFENAVDGGWPAIRRANRDLALAGRRLLLDALGTAAPAPASMIGSLASIPLPPGSGAAAEGRWDPLQDRLWHAHRVEVPVFSWPDPPRRLLRLSAQLYNRLEQYRYLAEVLIRELAREP